MVETPSGMLPLGTKMPGFSLEDAVTGKMVSDHDASAGKKATLIMFICNHCPFVKHVMDELGRLAADYIPKGAAVVAINSNDVESYPEDAPSNMKKLAASNGWRFPFLFDKTQEVAKNFKAACTPDFFLYDAGGKLAYRGQLDDSRPGNSIPVTGKDLRAALDAVLAGKAAAAPQKPSIGCNIKWKRGNEPPYFG
jgi:thiol-disulfide isomerase/thioredoxin